MTDLDPFESRFQARLRQRADSAVRPVDAVAMTRAIAASADFGSGWRRALDRMRIPARDRVLVVAFLVTLLAAAGVVVGSQLVTPAPTTQPLGAFTPAGTLDVAMEPGYFTATGLPDGRVLVVGGCASCGMAHVWDPTTMAFSPAGALPEGRDGHSATLLPDGRVLILGGYVPPEKGGQPPSVVAELWDTTTLTFSAAGTHSGYLGSGATMLADGRILVKTGGAFFDCGSWSPSTMEIWDPADRSSHPAGTIPDIDGTHRYNFSMTALADGRVLIVGGEASDGCNDDRQWPVEAAVWDPRTQAYGPAGSLRQPRMNHTATRLADGRVLIAGGYIFDSASSQALASAELWDPATETFGPAGTLQESRSDPTATLLPDGRVLILGGGSKDDGPTSVSDDGWRTLATAELWDPGQETFSPAGSLDRPRAGFAVAALPDGTVFILGGEQDPAQPTDEHGNPLNSSAVLWAPRP